MYIMMMITIMVKDPGHFAKSAGGRLQLNTHAPYVFFILHEVT